MVKYPSPILRHGPTPSSLLPPIDPHDLCETIKGIAAATVFFWSFTYAIALVTFPNASGCTLRQREREGERERRGGERDRQRERGRER